MTSEVLMSDEFEQFIASDEYNRAVTVWIAAHARPLYGTGPWHWVDGTPSGSILLVISK